MSARPFGPLFVGARFRPITPLRRQAQLLSAGALLCTACAFIMHDISYALKCMPSKESFAW